jgi:transposase
MMRRGHAAVRVLKRARVLQLLDRGDGTTAVADAVGVSTETVRRVARRYATAGLERALFEAPRPGAARRLTERQATAIVAMVCATPPEGFRRWSVRLITREAVRRRLVPAVGRETIRRLLETHDLKPWREKKLVRSCAHAGVRGAHGGPPRPV